MISQRWLKSRLNRRPEIFLSLSSLKLCSINFQKQHHQTLYFVSKLDIGFVKRQTYERETKKHKQKKFGLVFSFSDNKLLMMVT